ncbi:MAG: 50S ribosomal protein L29 [Puniceicoccales bacterium]|jgi:large subunit ribosomal protein L29|nr:50S ribosomal protein L29 [Puniceicoccales bacterium]
MKAKEIRKLDGAERGRLLAEKRHELLRLRLRRTTGQVDKTHQFVALRRDIARLCTAQREAELALAGGKLP